VKNIVIAISQICDRCSQARSAPPNRQNELIVIEAKHLDYGFTQLAAEMIALDQWERTPDQATLLGAVTTGKVWEFGLLHRATKHIEQGLDSYRVPDDLDPLMRILVQALY
jgi:hypothetical protein